MDPTQIPLGGQTTPAPNMLNTAGQILSLQDQIARTQIEQNAAQTSGITLKDLTDTRNAVAQNTTTDPNTGQPTLDMGGTLATLGQTNPNAALSFKMNLQQHQAQVLNAQLEVQGKQLDNATKSLNVMSNVMGAVKDQQSYDVARQTLTGLGMDESKLPTTYDPTYVDQLQTQGMSANDQVARQLQARDVLINQNRNDREGLIAGANLTREIGNSYSTSDQTKNYIDLTNKYQNIQLLKKNPILSQGLVDNDLLYAYQGMVNQGGIVHTNQAEMDQNARSALQNIGVDVKNWTDGSTLAPAQRQEIFSMIDAKYQDATNKQAIFHAGFLHQLQTAAQNGIPGVDIYGGLPTIGGVEGSDGKIIGGIKTLVPSGYTPPSASGAPQSSPQPSGAGGTMGSNEVPTDDHDPAVMNNAQAAGVRAGLNDGPAPTAASPQTPQQQAPAATTAPGSPAAMPQRTGNEKVAPDGKTIWSTQDVMSIARANNLTPAAAMRALKAKGEYFEGDGQH